MTVREQTALTLYERIADLKLTDDEHTNVIEGGEELDPALIIPLQRPRRKKTTH